MTFTEAVHLITRVFESIRYHDQIPMAISWCNQLILHRDKTSGLDYHERREDEYQLESHISACTERTMEHLKSGRHK